MKKMAMAAFLSAGFVAAPMFAAAQEATERPEIPAVEDATLADCQVWLDLLSDLVDRADPPVAEDVMSEAEERRDQVAQACDDGNYHAGIEMASETVEMIEEAAED